MTRLYKTGCSVAPPPTMVLLRRAILAGLVIGDAELHTAGLLLDQIDRAAQEKAAVDQDGIGDAARIARLRRTRPKLNSKYSGCQSPLSGRRRAQTRRSRRDVGNLVAPDPVDRGREPFVVVGGDPRDDRVEHGQRPRQGDLRAPAAPPASCSSRKNARLHLVEERAAGERIELLQRLGVLRGLQPVNRRQQELVRTRSKISAARTASTGVPRVAGEPAARRSCR